MTRLPLTFALCMATIGCTAIAATDTQRDADTPVACTLSVTSERGTLLIEGIVSAETSLFGTYALAVTRGGASINQSGLLDIDAGETVTLGNVRMNGPILGLNASLILTVDDEDYACERDT